MRSFKIIIGLLVGATLLLNSCKDEAVDATCTDGIKNGTETGIDCGGPCVACVPTSCTDGIKNGNETGVDCGGSCPPCPTCDDGIMNGDETGIDCGGSKCPACPTCDDGIMNGDETGIDCGGSVCPACPTCDDGIMNGKETGIDCGGPDCPPCFTCPATIKDVDGNVYAVVKIGKQCWTQENLKTSTYNDFVKIPYYYKDADWAALRTGGYSVYDHSGGSGTQYGNLYNWRAVNTKKLCPTGWHVPSDQDWTILSDELGGESIAGGELKQKGTSMWDAPNTGATNNSEFSAIPAGYRGYGGKPTYMGRVAYFWASTFRTSGQAYERNLWSDNAQIGGGWLDEEYGMSVRCVRD